jgi:hypothetical protein
MDVDGGKNEGLKCRRNAFPRFLILTNTEKNRITPTVH